MDKYLNFVLVKLGFHEIPDSLYQKQRLLNDSKFKREKIIEILKPIWLKFDIVYREDSTDDFLTLINKTGSFFHTDSDYLIDKIPTIHNYRKEKFFNLEVVRFDLPKEQIFNQELEFCDLLTNNELKISLVERFFFNRY